MIILPQDLRIEMTFQNMLFKDDQKERMVMSKYDFKMISFRSLCLRLYCYKY